jgi:DNA-binding NtrC family response regulator
MKKPAILLAEHDETLRKRWQVLLSDWGAEVIVLSDIGADCRAWQERQDLDLLILNPSFKVPDGGLEVLHGLNRFDPHPPVILLMANSSEELAIAALRAGVSDYLKAPFSDQELLSSVQRCLARERRPQTVVQKKVRRESQALRASRTDLAIGGEIIGESLLMQKIKAYLLKVAATESNTLITGETGTGKELVASLIHANSRRRQKPFVCINCAAIPDSLLESELFGYERGAFTGAHALKEGKLKLADGGTVFFDEIGDMSLYAQAKVLRAIESRAVERLGGTRSLPLDVRVIAATHRNLEELITEGKFRADLYFRLNVARIQLPPLRERKEDLSALCACLISDMNRRFGLAVAGVAEDALAALLRYDWPGNVRELRNAIEAAFVNRPTRAISLADLPAHLRHRSGIATELPQDERDQLLGALFATNWNKSQAAQKLRWSRMTLYRKMTKYHIINGGHTVPVRKRGPEDPHVTVPPDEPVL